MDAGTTHAMSWTEVTKGHVPPPLTGPSVTISPLPLPHPPTIYLFGGKSVLTRRLTANMWAMDISSRTWTQIDPGPGPSPRYFHSMDVYQDKLVCFGGMSDAEPNMAVHNDVWVFDCLARRWLPQPSPSGGIGLGIEMAAQDPGLVPSPRYAHLSAISRGQLVVSGGQHSDNSWIYEINVYDLQSRVWVSKTEQPQAGGMFSKGAYRSVAASSSKRVISPAPESKPGSQSYSVDEAGEGGDVWCYSNYDFAKVRRELDIISPSSSSQPTAKHSPPPNYEILDKSALMRGSSQPPGLRFPTGGIVGNHFILCGLYLASVSGKFSIWALNMDTMTWRHIEPAALAGGSWNRAVVWAERGKVLVFGNSQLDLAQDYSRRAVNLDHMAVISLEAFGIYQPPSLVVPPKVQQTGLSMMDEKLASDFEVICDDGRRVKCSRKVLSERWPWFNEQEKTLGRETQNVLTEAPAVDINDTLLGSFTPARLSPSTLTLSEPFPVCVALVQYFYTLSLSTPLQNRAPILSALLFMGKQYGLERLVRLVVHALHGRLEGGGGTAVGIYEIATLAGERDLQVRALNIVHGGSSSSSRGHRSQPDASTGVENGTSPSNEFRPQGGAAGNGAPAGNTQSGSFAPGEAPIRRARADSDTIPFDTTPLAESDVPEEDHRQVTALLSSLRVKSNGPASSLRPSIAMRRQSERSLASAASAQSPLDSPVLPPLLPPRSAMRVPPPPIAPPPAGRLPPVPNVPNLPKTPDLANSSCDHRHSGGIFRPSSPTNSDATNLPATPSESLRESWILPQHRDWSISTGSGGGGMMDSRSSSGSGLTGLLPVLPEDDPMPTHGNGRFDLFPWKKQAMTEHSLLPPASLHHSQSQGQGQTQRSQSPNVSPISHNLFSFESSPLPTRAQSVQQSMHNSPIPPTASRVASYSSSTFSPTYQQILQNNRHLSIATQSSGTSGLSNMSGMSNPLSPTGTDWSEESIGGLIRSYTGKGKSGMGREFDSSSISSGSTGTSSKKAAKEEAKLIREAEKRQKKAEAQAHFEQLRAEQARKMALSKAEAQRRDDIAAANSKAQLDKKVMEKAAMEREREQEKADAKSLKGAGGSGKKSKWGKLANGFKDAVLFPEGGSQSTMF
ncbi:regulatory protein ral2 [Cryptococcus wingfieldii CBS 7118]|uniref:Regulatory protein ral2 n=1 Tax=Cryptococcus wingfieldii CBS 7118 TaxID=1295528 RepID=A0A1E3IBV6_9TREE|nr:regulatory protein ral2 [Cryptococcus wingfieldii CBS 7118]ODN86083.1 regulatory protein ral2 [Cryptococcus wingfieldii CBS 7118]